MIVYTARIHADESAAKITRLAQAHRSKNIRVMDRRCLLHSAASWYSDTCLTVILRRWSRDGLAYDRQTASLSAHPHQDTVQKGQNVEGRNTRTQTGHDSVNPARLLWIAVMFLRIVTFANMPSYSDAKFDADEMSLIFCTVSST